ncbi:MAG: hypothetical protein LBJ92_01705 [Holosporales bacterium]|jgi:hypothetical protein|nr:hypothetical protein [Holosporales bacterium]
MIKIVFTALVCMVGIVCNASASVPTLEPIAYQTDKFTILLETMLSSKGEPIPSYDKLKQLGIITPYDGKANALTKGCCEEFSKYPVGRMLLCLLQKTAPNLTIFHGKASATHACLSQYYDARKQKKAEELAQAMGEMDMPYMEPMIRAVLTQLPTDPEFVRADKSVHADANHYGIVLNELKHETTFVLLNSRTGEGHERVVTELTFHERLFFTLCSVIAGTGFGIALHLVDCSPPLTAQIGAWAAALDQPDPAKYPNKGPLREIFSNKMVLIQAYHNNHVFKAMTGLSESDGVLRYCTVNENASQLSTRRQGQVRTRESHHKISLPDFSQLLSQAGYAPRPGEIEELFPLYLKRRIEALDQIQDIVRECHNSQAARDLRSKHAPPSQAKPSTAA